jgi:ABC-type branched-subunit amino acid transport system substrate-binding protein
MGRTGRPLVSIGVALALAGGLAACSSSGSASGPGANPTTTSSGTGPGITPADSATKTSCPSASSCFVSGNIATVGGPVPGLFKGATVGADAFLAYQNSRGGVDGRKFRLLTGDDQFNCSQNRSLTESMIGKVIAFTGNFSLQDNCGGVIIGQHPDVPDVSVTLDPTTTELPNVFSAAPATGFSEGPFKYFAQRDPNAVKHVGTLVADVSSSLAQFAYAKGAMQHSGWKIVYERTVAPLESDFTSDVLAMQQKGVQTVFLYNTDEPMAARFLQEAATQGFHPKLIVGGPPIYTGTFVKDAGGASVADGTFLEQPASLYLGGDAASVPEVKTFLRWVDGVYPGFTPDLFTLYGWVSADLYVTALEKAGPHPTQQSLDQALRGITSFDAGGIIPAANPAGKQAQACFLLARIENGQFKRYDMPASGYRCDGEVYPPAKH